ncbi:MAG: Zn-dependent alcohol dehydrogenase [Acidimicrobiales bacterium]|nr:MAG: Zn-dependent alcohol dehydrogenase [Acidimicrobiales bacterium]
MRAAIMTALPTETLEVVDDITLRELAPGEVQVKVAHSGVCHSDLSAMQGTLPSMVPMVLGHEGAGVVTAVGDGVDHVAPGDHIVIAFSPPCGACAYCNERHQPNLCLTGTMTMLMHQQFMQGDTVVGSMTGCGTFAEETIVPAMAAIKIDDDIPLDVAALVGCGVTTGVGAALNGAKVTHGSSVAVIGCGGVGIAAIQGARIAGASAIVAIDLHEGKLERAMNFGATHVATPDSIDAVRSEVTGDDGFDFAIECIGRAATMRQAYDLIRRGGVACIVGAGSDDDILEIRSREPFFDEKTLVGSMYGSVDVREDFERFLDYYRHGQLDLEGMITQRIDLDGINDALASLGNADVIRQVIDF